MLNLHDFCYKGEGRDNLLKPFSIGDKTYATNGHILVCVDRDQSFGEIENPPKVESCLEDFFKPEGLRPMVYGTLPTRVIEYTKEEKKKCVHCDGAGECSCCGQECPECDGGWVFASREEIKDSYDDKYVKIGNAAYHLQYIALLHLLEGVMIQSEPHESDPLSFTFKEGVGLLMPVRVGSWMKDGLFVSVEV